MNFNDLNDNKEEISKKALEIINAYIENCEVNIFYFDNCVKGQNSIRQEVREDELQLFEDYTSSLLQIAEKYREIKDILMKIKEMSSNHLDSL